LLEKALQAASAAGGSSAAQREWATEVSGGAGQAYADWRQVKESSADRERSEPSSPSMSSSHSTLCPSKESLHVVVDLSLLPSTELKQNEKDERDVKARVDESEKHLVVSTDTNVLDRIASNVDIMKNCSSGDGNVESELESDLDSSESSCDDPDQPPRAGLPPSRTLAGEHNIEGSNGTVQKEILDDITGAANIGELRAALGIQATSSKKQTQQQCVGSTAARYHVASPCFGKAVAKTPPLQPPLSKVSNGAAYVV
jgi:hypothetical protein